MLQTDIQDPHSLFPDLLDELLLPPERVLHGVPDHLELPPALAQGQALGHHVQRDQLGLQGPLAVLLGTLDVKVDSNVIVRLSRHPISWKPPLCPYLGKITRFPRPNYVAN